MKFRINQAALAAAAVLSLAAAHANAAPAYAITFLDTTTPQGMNAAHGINASGVATGVSAFQGFVSNGSGPATMLSGAGYAINASGQVTGVTVLEDHKIRAFVYDGSTSTTLGTLAGDDTSWGYGINASGQVVGTSSLNGVRGRAFLYEKGEMKELSAPGGEPVFQGSSTANAINDAGQITGRATTTGNSHAYIYSNGQVTDLGTLIGDSELSEGHAINAQGHVTGSSSVYGTGSFYRQTHAFLHDGTRMIDLDPTYQHDYSVGLGINSRDEVVGLFQDFDEASNSYGPSRAFLYSHATGTFMDLTELVAGEPIGWTVTQAYAINDLGSIAARVTDHTGQEHAVILRAITPVPEPSTFALGLTGLLALGLMRRGRRQTDVTTA